MGDNLTKKQAEDLLEIVECLIENLAPFSDNYATRGQVQSSINELLEMGHRINILKKDLRSK